jgi:hypothetical protein
MIGSASFYSFDARMMAIPATIDESRKFRMDPDGFGLPTLLDDILGHDPERFISLEKEFCEYFPEFRKVRLQTEMAASRAYAESGLHHKMPDPSRVLEICGEGKTDIGEIGSGRSSRARLPAPQKNRAHNPKTVLAKCARRSAVPSQEATRIAQAIADTALLRQRCPIGFEPFAQEVEERIAPLFR